MSPALTRLQLAQAVTATDRLLVLGRPRKRDVGLHRAAPSRVAAREEPTVHVAPRLRRRSRSGLVLAFSFAAVIASLGATVFSMPHAHAAPITLPAR